MWSARFLSHMNHLSVSPTDGNGPTQGQRKTLTKVGVGQTLVRVFLCPCVGPFPSVGLTLTWFIWDRNLALHITLYSVNSIYLIHTYCALCNSEKERKVLWFVSRGFPCWKKKFESNNMGDKLLINFWREISGLIYNFTCEINVAMATFPTVPKWCPGLKKPASY